MSEKRRTRRSISFSPLERKRNLRLIKRSRYVIVASLSDYSTGEILLFDKHRSRQAI